MNGRRRAPRDGAMIGTGADRQYDITVTISPAKYSELLELARKAEIDLVDYVRELILVDIATRKRSA
jgi:hypothetical protein